MFSDLLDIYTIHSSTKLLYYCIGLYVVEKQVGLMLYYPKLLSILQRLHLIFPVVKLTTAPNNLIPKRYSTITPDSIIIDREEEWKIKKILNSY